jgi:hypothetical protein
VIPGANHFFENCVDPLIEEVRPISTSASAIRRACRRHTRAD